jgi:hypothetical protein
MKTSKYIASSMGLISSPATIVTTAIGGQFITTSLAELPEILKRDNLTGGRPMATQDASGSKVGIFPVLKPKTHTASLALMVKGYSLNDAPIPVGDGVSLVTQSMARTIAAELKKLGVSMEELEFEWMMGVSKGLTAEECRAAAAKAGTIEAPEGDQPPF